MESAGVCSETEGQEKWGCNKTETTKKKKKEIGYVIQLSLKKKAPGVEG